MVYFNINKWLTFLELCNGLDSRLYIPFTYSSPSFFVLHYTAATLMDMIRRATKIFKRVVMINANYLL